MRASAREMLKDRQDGVRKVNKKRKAKAKALAPAKAKVHKVMARKYLIETYGCQMNVHDSERMAGLLEQAGYEPTDDDQDADVVLINTCSVREKAEEKLFTRLGEFHQMELETGRRPIVAVAGCVAQQEGRRFSGARKRSTSSSGRRISSGCRCSWTRPSRRRSAARRASISIRSDDVSFPLGIARRSDPLKAYVTIIEGCNEFCAFCVVPYTRGHERMRPVADILAEARHAVDDRRPRDPAARADRQPLPGAGRCRLRLRRPARAARATSTASSASASPARIRATSRPG